MNKSFLILSFLLIIGIASAVEYGPTGAVGAPDISEMGVPAEALGRANMIPKSIPQEIIDAGAETEYLAVTCAMAKYNMQKFVDGADAVKKIWDDVILDLSSEDIIFDTSALLTIKEGVLSKVDNLCLATAENYGQAINDLIDFSIGTNGLEQQLKSMGIELENKIRTKMDEYTAESASIQAEIDAMTGGLSQDEIISLTTQMQSYSTELQALTNNPSAMQNPSNVARVEFLSTEIQSIQASLGATTNEDQQRGIELGEEAQSFGEKVQALGTKIEKVFGGISERMNAAFQGNDYSNLKAEVNEMYYALFLKVFNAKVIDVDAKKAEISVYGIDTSVFDEVTVWANLKKQEAKSVFVETATEEDIKDFIELINLESAEMEIRINSNIEGLIREKYIDNLDTLRSNAEAGIVAANNGGLDTTDLESLTLRLETLREEAMALDNAGNDSEAFEKIQEAERLVELLKVEYANLQSQGENAQAEAQAVIEALNAEKGKILALKEAAQSLELDTTLLTSLESELYSLESQATSLLNSGENAQALLLVQEAKNKFESLKFEYSRLLSEVKAQ